MNKQAELTRWTPKRLLSLLMALIMTLSLLPTAAFAAEGDTIALSAAHWDENNKTQQLSSYTYFDSSDPNFYFLLEIGFDNFTPSTNLYPGAEVEIPFKCNFTGTLSPQKITFTFKDLNSYHGTSIEDSEITIIDKYTGTLPALVGGDGSLRFTVQSSYTLANSTSGSSDLVTVQIKDLVPASTWQVKFHMNDGTDAIYSSVPVQGGYGTTRPSDPTREGYKFAGWYTEANSGSLYDFGAPVTADTNVYAHWTADGTTQAGSHTVNFLPGAADAYIPFVATATVKDGTNYTIPTNKPTREGYTFEGWSDGTNTYQAGGTITGVTTDIVLSAKWTATPVTIKIVNQSEKLGVTVTPSSHSPSVGQSAYFSVAVPPKYDVAKMFVFAGITDGEHEYLVPESQHIDDKTGNVIFYYKFNVKEGMTHRDENTGELTTLFAVGPVTVKAFNVTLPTGAGFDAKFTDLATTTNDKITTVDYDGTVSFTVKPRPGYTVEGVYANGVKLDPDTSTTDTYTIKNIKSNQAVMVDMAAVQFHTVTYVLDGAQMATQSVQDNVTLTPLSAPNKTGYTWNNTWYTDATYNTEFDTTVAVIKDTVLYGRYTPNKATISYDLKDGSWPTGVTAPAPVTKTYGLAATLTEIIPVKDGCTFLGWSETDGAAVASYLPGATFSKEIDHNITLYAVWQKQTFNISLSSGTGYSIHHTQPLQVEYGDTFSFRVAMSKGYSQTAPSVWMNWVDAAGTEHSHQLTNPTETTDGTSGLAVYHYTTPEIYWNATINVVSAADLVYTVTYKYAGLDGRTEYPKNDDTYLTQNVSWNEAAAQPAAPSVDGYKFVGWYKDAGLTTPWDFATEKVIGPTTIYAKLTAIEPVITWPTTTPGYEFEFTAPTALVGNMTGTGKVDYGSTVTFTIKILEGYDASKMQVGINGQLLAPKEINGDTYTFEFTAKQDTKITVVGVERKTVTIIYNDNGGYGGPVQETVNYYLLNDTNNDKISTTKPTRAGYDFLGWAKANDATVPAYSNPKKADPATTDVADFTSDTVLYAVWKAKETGIKLEVSNTIDDTATLKAQYEGEDVTLTATIKSGSASVTTGSVQFYRCTDADPTATTATWTLLNSAVVSGGTAIYKAETSGFKYGGTNKDTYKAVFIPTEGNGYTEITSDTEAVTVKSTAISWKLDTTTDPTAPKINTDANKLTIKQNGTTVDSMVAGQVYTLELPAIYALDEQNTKLTVNKDYSVTWQYRNDKGVWTDYTNSGSGDTTTVDAAYSQYVFRAVVTPVTGATSHFTKAAKYGTGNALEKGQYETVLISEPTAEVTLQTTKTDLVITGHNIEEDAGTVINGTAKFDQKHLAQFEGQTVILKATVIDSTSKNAVADGGKVYFYRYVDGKNDVKLNQTAIVVNNGIAELSDVTIKAYDASTGKYFSSDANIDRFYAVYEGDATYATSASVTYDASTGYAKPVSVAAATADSIFVKSTTIQTPIIESKLEGEGGKKATTYIKDLTGLLAGVQHEFKLRTGNAEPDWSVVALDGRTVDAKNYTIQWITKSGDNAETTAATGSEFMTSDNKVDDEIYVRLNPTGDMKTGADSKKAIIGKKQDVTVTVKASADWVYQLNDITLTATVAAADSAATMPPKGSVTFYYSVDGGTTWTKIGDTKDLAETAGVMTASITTTELPVDQTKNTKQDVKITAVYEGNETFAVSGNYDETTDTVSAGNAANGVADKTVTVYSSVVYAGNSENKAADQSMHGISITANGALKANESSVTLTLDQVYTLDHDIPLSKLTYNTDYTVQWQILRNAIQHQDSSSTGSYATTDKWEDLSGQTGTSYTGMMEQDAAYRAKITVKDTPIAKGSFTKVDQAIKGRDVYYSNVLVVGVGMATVTTNITTSANQKFNEEGIVSGETATIHVLASGAAKTTPISTVTATITNANGDEVFKKEANNVNGYTSFAWDTANLTPGYYTLTVTAESNNGYAPQTITRTLIVRDNAYTLTATKESKVYNGKAQGIDWALTGVDIEDALAQKSVVVYYYDKDGKMVEPTQAGKYQYDLYLPASAYWTELTHVSGTFIIEKRPVEVVDLVAQAKVYDGTTNANIQEIILNDAKVNSTTGLPTDGKGIIDGDSVYAVGTGYTSLATAGTAKLGVKDVSLKGDDAANYDLTSYSYTEDFNIQRSQVKGAIVSGRTYKYTGKDIKLAASDIYLIDQAGSQLTDYDVTYYYHNGDGVEQVSAMNKMGKYTVIARPEQDNYKGGATETVYVGNTDTPGTLDNNAKSSLITISNTVELYGATTGVTVSATKGTATASYYYDGAWKDNAPTAAGRYLVKATVTNDGVTDTAYGLYTVVKARPALTLTATGATYNSAQYNGAPTGTYNNDPALPADTYFTYTGGTIQGVAYEAPTEAGDYVVTAHVGKAANYTAHEISANFTIAQAALTIKADDLQRWQYGSFPDMVASYQGLATGGIAADTSLRDVQIQPEFLFNEQNGGYTNHAFDQVGTYPVTVRNALARNYTVTYVGGTIATTAEEPKAELAIHGMPDNGTTTENLVYYGDTIQLYAYGYYKTLNGDSQGAYNTSSLIEWKASGPATITQDGLLTVTGVGPVKVTLTRGSGSAAISTDINVEAKPKEVSIDVPDVDKVYTASEQIYDSTPTVNGLINSDSVTPTVTAGTNKRTVVGSQITSYTVNDAKYVSETYGGLFTINVKDVDIKPTAANTTYGTLATGLTYTEVTPASSDKVLTDGKAVSVADVYGNLDVLDGYEILVAGRENENYNVKYVTDQDAFDVEVTAKDLTIKTGTLNDQTGMTSGSLNPMGKYPVNGAAIDDPAPAMGPSNVRMYGEPNWVMDETLDTLISGDTLADLAALNEKLVSFNYNIGADANVSYTDKSTKLAVSGSPMPDYEILTDASKMAFKNYNETYTLGTQNIYQRPVTLSVPSGMTLTAYKPSILDSSNQVKNDVLLNLLLNNLIVSKYNNEGGLAELLKHTIKDLDIQIKSTQVTGDKLTVKIALGNQNYWLDSASSTIEIELVSTKIVPVYSPLDWTSFTVTMYNETKTTPVAISGNVRFFIFQEKDGVELKYSNYKNDTIIRSGLMDPTGRTGEFRATFSRLPAGDYAIFAIAENYTIVE